MEDFGTGEATFRHLDNWQRSRAISYHGDSAPVAAATTGATTWVPGRATGPLLGGDLAAIRALIGAGLPDLTGAILLLTGVRTLGLGQVDRQLTHLHRAGVLAVVAGVAVGRFTGFDGFTDRGWTLTDVLHDQLSRLPVPVLAGLPVGPGCPAVPLGVEAVLDADHRTLTVTPPPATV